MKSAKWKLIISIATLALACCERTSPGKTQSGNGATSVGKQIAPVRSEVQVDSVSGVSESESSSSKYLNFKVGSEELFVLKIADSKTIPSGNFIGKESFVEKAKSVRGQVYLLHILLPPTAKGISLRTEVEGKSVPLMPPSLIYRMPTSPLRVYVILEGGSTGKLIGTMANGSSGSLEFGRSMEKLEALELYWSTSDSGHLDYHELPSSLYGKMGG